MTATPITAGYEQAPWRRRAIRVMARDLGLTDREMALVAPSDDDLRRHVDTVMQALRVAKRIRDRR